MNQMRTKHPINLLAKRDRNTNFFSLYIKAPMSTFKFLMTNNKWTSDFEEEFVSIHLNLFDLEGFDFRHPL